MLENSGKASLLSRSRKFFPRISIYIGSVSFQQYRYTGDRGGVVLMVALQWMVTSTRIGRAMRAVAQDREAAALMGVNVNRIIAITFFIGAALAGAAGTHLRFEIRKYQFHTWFYTWTVCLYCGGAWRNRQPCWRNAWRCVDRCDRSVSYPYMRFYPTWLPYWPAARRRRMA